MGMSLDWTNHELVTWMLLFVTQNGYGATSVRMCDRSVRRLVGRVIAGVTLHLDIPESITLAVM
ncbi:hypothetical protein, partial [Salmonella enterica]|uniref:hypothetical protein n=1 Tax=Salmonella enterica TaxID=28901 RepID=UPI00398C2FC8